jgi:XTP/dITP diphosphohydrolase
MRSTFSLKNPMRRRLLVASSNSHKTAEIRAILGPDFDVSDLGAYPNLPPVEETGSSFAENATIKALSASHVFDGLVLADDSGLEVDALGGAPGVWSARYAGTRATDTENRAKLLRELAAAGARGKQRRARFRCVIALARAGTLLGTFDGAVEGVIINAERGEGGFGYDALFVPEGHCETFAQISRAMKNRLSHRARALAKVRESFDALSRTC